MSEMRVSEVTLKPELPVSRQFNEFSQSQDLTVEVITGKLLTSDGDLALKTNIPDSVGLTLMQLLANDARTEGYEDVAKLYDGVIKDFRENQCSKAGWRSTQVVNVLKGAVQTGGNDEKVGVRESLYGSRREK